MRPTQLNVLGIQSVAQNVVFLDLSFTVLSYTQELGEMLMIMKCTLRGLSLRGSGSNDGFIGDFVSRLTQLKYLNVSQTKSDEKANITDDGARHLCALKQLKWLNISMTNITAASITSLQAAVPSLTHLDVYGCKLLSDEVVPALLRWKLRSVDLSNCPLLTTRAFEMICANT